MARPKRYETLAEKQRAYRDRKKANPGDPRTDEERGSATCPACEEEDEHITGCDQNIRPRPTIAELRELVEKEQLKVPPKPLTVPVVYRNDFGGVISKTQWEKLQEKKRQAKEGGYSLDEYSQ